MIKLLKEEHPDFEYEIEDVREHISETFQEERERLIKKYKNAIKEE